MIQNVQLFLKNRLFLKKLCLWEILTTFAPLQIIIPMNKSDKQIALAAGRFAQRWAGKGYEKGESQLFWTELLTEVYGVKEPSTVISFEDQVQLDHTSFIDGYIDRTHTMIEQKSLGKDLRAPIKQSDGTSLTPFQQAQRYSAALPYSKRPRWIVTCNFSTFLVYDMEHPSGEPFEIQLADLGKEYYRLRFLVETGADHLEREMQVSMQAGAIVGKLYDALLKQYKDPNNAESLRSLNVLCVRLVFCLYSEDAGIFGKHDMFHDYLARYATIDMRNALMRLFQVLNTPPDQRDPYLQDDLAAFPWASGGLFEGDIEIPRINDEIRDLLLRHASLDFDWSEISPTIFGAVFESTLNPETRRSGGMHYTSVENIHKVIDPLFLNDLRADLDDILAEPVVKQRQRRLREFQDHLASLTFLDPACGSGNFLTETYLSLRHLENRVIRALYEGHSMFIGGDDFINPVKVSIYQFHGIEINDFAVTVAATALWISEAQMLAETERIVSHDFDFLPLKDYPNIVEANVLRIDWHSLFAPDAGTQDNPLAETAQTAEIRLPDYIMGNPPFIGYSLQSRSQKEDILSLFVDAHGKPYKTAGKIDYVAGWYYKAAQLMQGTTMRAALVSTNSITQGEQVAAIWKPLKDLFNIKIDFAHRTFRWDSEAAIKAHVHCVIVGFSCEDKKDKIIFDHDEVIHANNINGYLIDAPDVYIESRNTALCDIPLMQKGSIPVDDGNLIIEDEDYHDFLCKEPKAINYIRRFVGAREFIHNKPRYCLWLLNASPSDINSMPLIHERIKRVRDFRLSSPKEATRKYADYPARFMEIRQPNGNYVLVPSHSSENRRYIPMGFMTSDIICGNANLMVPDASLYHFGVLESSVHMAWTRITCGRIKSDYRYSKDIVYNNFPWPEVTEDQRAKIERTAQAILDARALYPDSSLADLYDPVTMPPELLKAHRDNDRAVMAAYAFPSSMTEGDIVARLFALYTRLTLQD